MTREKLREVGIKISEHDAYNCGIYAATYELYYYSGDLYEISTYNNSLRYNGENDTYILVDDIKSAMDKYNNFYFKSIGVSEDDLSKLERICQGV